MLLQRIFSAARVGATGIHPERNVMMVTKRGNRHLLADKGDDLSTSLVMFYATIFVVGSLAGPGYIFFQFKKLKTGRDADK